MFSLLLAGGFLAACTSPAMAQSIIGAPSGLGAGGAGGFGGASGGAGGFGGNSFGGGMAGTSFSGGGFSGGMTGTSFSGGGFSGGMTGTSFSGTGGLGFSGSTTGMQGTTRTGGGYVGMAGGTGGVQPSNPFRATYANPYALGYAGGTGQVAFGQPIIGVTTTGQQGIGMTGQAGPVGSIAPGGIVSASSIGVRRAPAYATTLGFPYRPPAPSKLATDLQGVINRSSSLSGVKDNIRVSMAGRMVILEGTVPTPRERRLAEALVRLEPGVAAVQNRLVVASPRSQR
jgi:hypothetical protein